MKKVCSVGLGHLRVSKNKLSFQYCTAKMLRSALAWLSISYMKDPSPHELSAKSECTDKWLKLEAAAAYHEAAR